MGPFGGELLFEAFLVAFFGCGHVDPLGGVGRLARVSRKIPGAWDARCGAYLTAPVKRQPRYAPCRVRSTEFLAAGSGLLMVPRRHAGNVDAEIVQAQ
ncbi:hypothetical protein GCM10010199_48060 [Dactylosporangium roseum]